MKANKTQTGSIVIILIILVIILGVVIFLWNPISVSETETQSSTGGGRVVFVITDAAAEMGSVTQLLLTVEGVSAHSSAEGWTTLSSSSKTYDLLELKAQNSLAVVADTKLDAGAYDQVRLDISKVIVVDSEGQHEAKLPSNELKINSDFEVKEDSTVTATFDFIVDESLHLTGNGRYIMAPVVQVETRENAVVKVKSNNRVEISGGIIKTNAKVGMDAEGKVGIGLKIPTNVDISLEDDGRIKVGGILTVGNKENAGGTAKSNTGVDARVGVENVIGVSGEMDSEAYTGY